MGAMIINAYCMRHGLKVNLPGPQNELVPLTPEGEEQIRQSARNNLLGIEFHRLWYTGLYRTLQVVTLATGELPNRTNGLSVIAEPRFGYVGCPFLEDLRPVIKEIKDSGKEMSVADWFRRTPNFCDWIQSNFWEAIEEQARDTYFWAAMAKRCNETFNWLIGGHSPVSELLALDQESTPALREADIIRYTIEVVAEGSPVMVRIVASDYIPRGF